MKIVNVFTGCCGGHHLHPPKPKKRRLLFNYKLGLFQSKPNPKPMLEITLTNEQQVTATLSPVTPKGKPVALDGPARWSVPSGDCTVNPTLDGMSAVIVSGEAPGDSEVLIEADADLGEGVVNIADTIRVIVVGAMASNLGLSLGTPEEKP